MILSALCLFCASVYLSFLYPIIMASRDSLVKNLSGTSEKLSSKNYLLWSYSFETFVPAHRKLKHLTNPPPDSKTDTYDD